MCAWSAKFFMFDDAGQFNSLWSLTSMTHIIKWTWQILWMLFVVATIVNRVTQAECSPYGSPISLDEVTELHFHKGRDTTYSRNPPLPQLTCTRGCEFQPDVVVCTNIKPKGRRSRWRCGTDLPAHLKIDETAIICELRSMILYPLKDQGFMLSKWPMQFIFWENYRIQIKDTLWK